MKFHPSLGLALAACSLIAAVPSAVAIPVTSGAAQLPVVIEGQARNGRTGFEAILKTPGPDPTMNPGGAPVWQFGTSYSFALSYTASTGSATWSIDFNRDNDFLDASESVTQANASLIGQTFGQVNLFTQGNALGNVTVSSFSINGTALSPIAATANNTVQQLYVDSTGQFGNGDILATGTFSFSANGNSDERPRLWVQLGDQKSVASLPDNGVMLSLFGLGLAGIAGMRRKLAK